MSDPKSIVIVILLIALAVLGYLYYESRQTTVKIDVPGFKFEAK
jgi:predicted negative regulator of RcsB-dependent stress response